MSVETKQEQIAALLRDGYVIVRGLVSPDQCRELRNVATQELVQAHTPIELEADLQYPGAPVSLSAPGGKTVRRLLDAYGRAAPFANFATSPDIAGWMTSYFGEPVRMSRAHHNCLMTKHPQYGSLTGWHRDARYWSFSRDDLVSAWLALGTETASNGALWLIPGSHKTALPKEAFDDAKFFRSDLPENRAMIEKAISPSLEPGDVLFFHCNTLHSAGKNLSDQVKFSLVFTYHALSNEPLPGTRSTSRPEVAI